MREQLRLDLDIEQVHIVREHGAARLCLHYDPNLLPLSRVRRLAEQEGASVSDRFRHEQIRFVGLDAADSADSVADVVRKLPGVQHASANYAAELLSVAYDTTAILGEWAEGAFLLFLFALGHAGEHYALGRARNAVNALGAPMPKTAQVRRDNVGLSRAARAIIRQNLAVSLGVIALLLVTSLFGLVQLSGAVILHEGSTIVVVLNALRLLAYRQAAPPTAPVSP